MSSAGVASRRHAEEIRDLIKDRMRRLRDTGLGDPDETEPSSEEPVSDTPWLETPEVEVAPDLGDAAWDPLWEVCADLGLPVSIVVVLGALAVVGFLIHGSALGLFIAAIGSNATGWSTICASAASHRW